MEQLERWLPVERFSVDARHVGNGSTYEVSSFGRIRRGDRILNPVADSNGYLRASFWVGGKAKKVAVHLLVAEAFLGPRPERFVTCHVDGHHTNNSAANLRYDTPIENERDKISHGTKIQGTRHHSNKLTEDAVREIRRRRADGITGRVLAAEFKINPATVKKIVDRVIWKHVA